MLLANGEVVGKPAWWRKHRHYRWNRQVSRTCSSPNSEIADIFQGILIQLFAVVFSLFSVRADMTEWRLRSEKRNNTAMVLWNWKTDQDFALVADPSEFRALAIDVRGCVKDGGYECRMCWEIPDRRLLQSLPCGDVFCGT